MTGASLDAALKMMVVYHQVLVPCMVIKPFSIFVTPFELIGISCIEVKGLGPFSGIVSVSSCV